MLLVNQALILCEAIVKLILFFFLDINGLPQYILLRFTILQNFMILVKIFEFNTI